MIENKILDRVLVARTIREVQLEYIPTIQTIRYGVHRCKQR